MKIAILYLTQDGHTKKITEYIAKVLDGETSLISLRDIPLPSTEQLRQFDCIVIGASIRYGHFDPILEQFIGQHYVLLNQKKTAFFSVNLTARKANRSTPETNIYTRKLLGRIQWKPNLVQVMAGALLYPRYGFWDRMMIRFIMSITKGDTDTSKEYEYTDWEKVTQFAKEICNL